MNVSEIWLYVRSFWPDWISRMGGTVSAGLLIWGALWNAPIPRLLVFLSAAVSYAIATFRVWHLEAGTVDRIYADIVLDWLKTKRPHLVTAALIASSLGEPEDKIKRGFHVLEKWRVLKNDRERGWTYNQIAAIPIESQFRRFLPANTP